jgi:hypothetical protein
LENIETIRLVEAPKLGILCYMIHNNTHLLVGALIIQVKPSFRSHIEPHIFVNSIDACTSVIQGIVPASLEMSLHTVKNWALNSVGPNLNAIVQFLKCFPYTEKLYIHVNFFSVKC